MDANATRQRMTDLSRDELRAHLSAVEAQVRAALRIVAAESKATQQAHNALRAYLSAALLRLQSDINSTASRIETKVETVLAVASSLGAQRRLATLIVGTLVLMFGLLIGLIAGGGYYILRDELQSRGITVPLSFEGKIRPLQIQLPPRS
jgi:ElaB/YqjD/DUF883 family membrane-anchored ribosome-binding protein